MFYLKINKYNAMLFFLLVTLCNTTLHSKSKISTFLAQTTTTEVVLDEVGVDASAPATSISLAIDGVEDALGGSGSLIKRAQDIDASLDGAQKFSGLTSFTVTSTATRSSNTVSIIGNDGSAGQTYSITYSSPIASGATFTLTNGRKSITLVNNSRGNITSASALATYLTGAYPVNFVISNNAAGKLTTLSTLLAGTHGGAAGTNTSIYGQAVTTVSAGAAASSALSTLGAALLTNATDNAVTDLAAARALFVTSLGATLEADAGTLSTLVGGTGATVQARIAAIYNALLTTPSGVVSTDLATARGYLVTTPGDTLQADIQALNVLLNGTATGSTAQARIAAIYNALLTTPTGVVATDLATARALFVTSLGATLEADAGTLSTLVGGTGATVQARIAAIYNALLTTPSGVVSTDLATARALFVTSLGATLEADAGTLSTLVGGEQVQLYKRELPLFIMLF